MKLELSLVFLPWSLGSCDEVRTLLWRGSQLGKEVPNVKPGVISNIDEKGKYLPAP